MSARKSPTIEITDPDTGQQLTLVEVVSPRGRIYYRKVPASNFGTEDRTPRQLEANATFAEIASSAFGKRASGGENAAPREVRKRYSSAFPPGELPRDRRSRMLQQQYRDLMGPDIAQGLLEIRATKTAVKAKVVRSIRESVPITRKKLPDLGAFPIPPY